MTQALVKPTTEWAREISATDKYLVNSGFYRDFYHRPGDFFGVKFARDASENILEYRQYHRVVSEFGHSLSQEALDEIVPPGGERPDAILIPRMELLEDSHYLATEFFDTESGWKFLGDGPSWRYPLESLLGIEDLHGNNVLRIKGTNTYVVVDMNMTTSRDERYRL